nr:hypothetical protein [uncultured Pseudoxanthomonas sp.]
MNIMDDKDPDLGPRFRHDALHALQLLRDLAIVNERTLRELGPLPPVGVPVPAKRRPNRAHPPASPAVQDDEMNPLQRIMTTSTLVAGALAACGQAPPSKSSPEVTPDSASTASAPTAPTPVSVPEPILPDSKAASAGTPTPVADDTKVEIERGPPIPSATLRKQVLALLDSLRTLEDMEHPHLESIFRVHMVKNPRVRDGHEYFGITTEGWTYRVSATRLDASSDPPTITIAFNNGVEPWTDQKPTYCTMDFEELANDIVALGYERAATRSTLGNKPSWGFGRDVPKNRTGFGVGIYLYYLDEGTEAERACASWLRISGGPRND